jgi:hybrid cluster-associated redox disulfide protein
MNPTMPMEKPLETTAQVEEKPEFSKDLIIMDVAKFYPEVVEVFMDYGLHCIGCHVSGYETVEEGAMGHGIMGDDFDNLLEDAKERIAENALKKEAK